MLSMGDAPWIGARDWANGRAAEALEQGNEMRLTLVSFADTTKRHLDSVLVTDWKAITDKVAKEWFAPSGNTRLFDSVIEELTILRAKRESRGDGCAGVFALFTDGYDNRSTRTELDMHTVVAAAREEGVSCLFIGANQDAVASGTSYGFSANQCLSTGSDPTTAANALKAIGAACDRAVSFPNSQDLEFSQLEREMSAPPPPYGST